MMKNGGLISPDFTTALFDQYEISKLSQQSNIPLAPKFTRAHTNDMSSSADFNRLNYAKIHSGTKIRFGNKSGSPLFPHDRLMWAAVGIFENQMQYI